MYSLFYFHSMPISTCLLLVIVILYSLHHTNSLRCYKCDSTDFCRMKTNDSFVLSRYQTVQCDYFCWKSISLGRQSNEIKQFIDAFLSFFYFVFNYLGNVRRGCGRKRCDVSHTIGLFSTSVCCQTDFCNDSQQFSLSKFVFIFFILIILIK